MATGEHHSELVVLDLFLREDFRKRTFLFIQLQHLWPLFMRALLFAKSVKSKVFRHTHDPCFGTFRDSLQRPNLKGPEERFLNSILCQFKSVQPEDPAEDRDNPSCLMAEQMVDNLVRRWERRHERKKSGARCRPPDPQ
jgi:hypothetical protein